MLKMNYQHRLPASLLLIFISMFLGFCAEGGALTPGGENTLAL